MDESVPYGRGDSLSQPKLKRRIKMEQIKKQKTEEETVNKVAEEEKKPTTILDPEEQIRMFARGKMTLQKPIQDGENVVKELAWDFAALTGAEYVDAMDRDPRAVNTFRITNTQAMHLFAEAAGKATPGIDATDIRRGLGIMDTQKAIQLATVFFTASNRVGNKYISNG